MLQMEISNAWYAFRIIQTRREKTTRTAIFVVVTHKACVGGSIIFTCSKILANCDFTLLFWIIRNAQHGFLSKKLSWVLF